MNRVEFTGRVDTVAEYDDFVRFRMRITDGPWITVFISKPVEPFESRDVHVVGRLRFSKHERFAVYADEVRVLGEEEVDEVEDGEPF
jgi:hypothetical protein